MINENFLLNTACGSNTVAIFSKCINKKCRISKYYKSFKYDYIAEITKTGISEKKYSIGVKNVKYYQPLVINANTQKKQIVMKRNITIPETEILPISQYKSLLVQKYGFQNSNNPSISNEYFEIFDQEKKQWVNIFEYVQIKPQKKKQQNGKKSNYQKTVLSKLKKLGKK